MNKSVIAVFLIGILAITGAIAYKGYERNQDIRDAMDAGDYDAWVQAHKEKFDEMTAKERFDDMQSRHQQMQTIRQAVSDGDYGAWVRAHEGLDMPYELSEEVFSGMQESLQEGQCPLGNSAKAGCGGNCNGDCGMDSCSLRGQRARGGCGCTG